MDFVALFEQYCSEHKSILHDAETNRRFFTDPEQFNPNTHNYPCVLLLELPERVRDNKSDNIFSVMEYELWFIKAVKQNDGYEGKAAQNEMLALAKEFVSRLKEQSGFDWSDDDDERIKYFHPEDCSFEKIYNLGLMGDCNWGATVRVTLGNNEGFVFDESKWNL